jgi:hypothetical protein
MISMITVITAVGGMAHSLSGDSGSKKADTIVNKFSKDSLYPVWVILKGIVAVE